MIIDYITKVNSTTAIVVCTDTTQLRFKINQNTKWDGKGDKI